MKNVAQCSVVAMLRCSQDWNGNVSRGARQLAAQYSNAQRVQVLDSTIISSIPTPNPSNTHVTTTPTTTMAPLADYLPKTPTLASRAITSSTIAITRRNLSVNSTQKVTLGIIVAYVVVIALLWNIPYVRWVLWPFKVSFFCRR